MAAQFFRGTQLEQNVKFKDKDKKLISQWQWSESFSKPINLEKIQLDVLQPWIEKRCLELMAHEDEIVTSYVNSQLQQAKSDNNHLCPKQMQLNLTGFMEDKTSIFMEELVNLLLEAASSETGVPETLVKEKQLEFERKKQIAQETALQNKQSAKWLDGEKHEDREDKAERAPRERGSRERDSRNRDRDYHRDRPSHRDRRDDYHRHSRDADKYSRREFHSRRRDSPPPSRKRYYSRSRSGSREKDYRREKRSRRDYRSRSRSPGRSHLREREHRDRDDHRKQRRSDNR